MDFEQEKDEAGFAVSRHSLWLLREHGLKAERVVSRSPLRSRLKGEKMKDEAEKETIPRRSQRDDKD